MIFKRFVELNFRLMRWLHFNNIPGPRKMPLIGHAHLYSPFGPFTISNLIDSHEEMYKKFGRIVHLKLGLNFILLFNPDDIETMYRQEGNPPQRPLFDALRQYRKSRNYKRMGLVTDNGTDWVFLRRHVNLLLRPPIAKVYLPAQEQIADDFVKHVTYLRDNQGCVRHLLPHLYLYTQESIGVVCFGKRLGCLDYHSENAIQFARVVGESLDVMGQTLLGLPWWRIFKTPTYKKLEQTQDFLWERTLSHLEDAKNIAKDNPEINPFLSSILLESTLNPMDVGLIITEIFQGGIDATATTIGMALYHLSNNPHCQEKLRNEIYQQNSPNPPNLENYSYLNACVKETLRLSPTAAGSARITPRELCVGGYQIPAKTVLLGCHPVIGRLKDFYTDPLSFQPERWIRDDNKQRPHAFASVPFGIGPRMCPGRRIAEQEIKLCLIKLLQKYRVSRIKEDGDVKMELRLNLTPNRPLNFIFQDVK